MVGKTYVFASLHLYYLLLSVALQGHPLGYPGLTDIEEFAINPLSVGTLPRTNVHNLIEKTESKLYLVFVIQPEHLVIVTLWLKRIQRFYFMFVVFGIVFDDVGSQVVTTIDNFGCIHNQLVHAQKDVGILTVHFSEIFLEFGVLELVHQDSFEHFVFLCWREVRLAPTVFVLEGYGLTNQESLVKGQQITKEIIMLFDSKEVVAVGGALKW